MQPELMKIKRDQARIQGEPVAKESSAKAKQTLFNSIPDDIKEVIKSGGIDSLIKTPIEAKVVNDTLTSAQDMVKTFIILLTILRIMMRIILHIRC